MVKRGISLLMAGLVLLLTCLLAVAGADEWQVDTARKLKQSLWPPIVERGPRLP